ncbi:54_t:CDS:2 [Ambispora gerdemannii]|uniref:54_t:CDS:1 n=1 Tax=Ambispora gerdemannii TaxID=144530 RepID=A0A9N9BZQ1_9GLOM|nr:54_t:CDS:2 [Ambispora gerdemannii]
MDTNNKNQKPPTTTDNLTPTQPAQNEISLLTSSLVKSRDSSGNNGGSTKSIAATTPIRIASSSQHQRQQQQVISNNNDNDSLLFRNYRGVDNEYNNSNNYLVKDNDKELTPNINTIDNDENNQQPQQILRAKPQKNQNLLGSIDEETRQTPSSNDTTDPNNNSRVIASNKNSNNHAIQRGYQARPRHINIANAANNRASLPKAITTTPGAISSSYAGERIPWSSLKHYSDGSFVTSPLQSSYMTADSFFPAGLSFDNNSTHPQQNLPNYNYTHSGSIGPHIIPSSVDDGRSLFSVIMDDGSKQRRRISLSSEYTLPRNPVSENVPLLAGDDVYDDSDTEDERDTPPLNNRYHLYHPKNRFSVYRHRLTSWFRNHTKLSTNSKKVIKCAVAYFLASMFTYIPALNALIGLTEAQNAHLVASVSVFFNPAKTIGGIFEAMFLALFAGCYGALVGVLSMASAVWFNQQQMYILGHVVSVVVWCGGSIFILAFLKATLKKPAFNSACSLCCIIIFVVLTKEGSVVLGEFATNKIFQVATIILVGASISFLVSVLLWPVSASDKLKDEIGKTLASFRLLLKLLTKTFLIDDIHYTDASVQEAITSHRATFTSLKASLNEAKLEIHNRAMQRELGLYHEVVKSLQRLAQHLGGLRSCCGLQWEMIKDKDTNNHNGGEGIPLTEGEPQGRPSGNVTEEEDYGDIGILLEFIHHVGPHMKSLAFTCKQTMAHLQDQLTKALNNESDQQRPSFTLLQENLEAALALFETSQTRAVTRLYKKETMNGHFDGRPNEEVFLIYFFVFNLQEFTRELQRLVTLVGKISKSQLRAQEIRRSLKWWELRRWFNWFFCLSNTNDQDTVADGANNSKKSNPKFPEHSHNLFNTIQTPKPKTKWQAFTIRLWEWSSLFRRYEVKYAFKTALSASILATPAFIDYTRPTYIKYRGEWACISMIVVMVPTVGGTNLMSFYRVLGTFLGGCLAFIAYTLFPDNGPILAIFGFLVALPCFYILMFTKYDRMGQFILLAYNLVALYKFNLRNAEDDEHLDLYEIAWYRSIAVGTGVLWGLFVTTCWWPYEARTELRKGLSFLIINMSWLYKELVSLYSGKTDNNNSNINGGESHVSSTSSNSTRSTVINLSQDHLSKSTKDFLELELFLQVSILELHDLLAQTPNEPRLKGPFPVRTYSKILTSCQNILDKMLSMRIAVTKEQFYDAIRRDFIIPINRERRELVGNVLLYFYVLAAALRLKTPLPPYLPPADQARRRMVKKIRDLPVVRQRFVEGNDEHYIVYYAYALVMEDIIRELENLGGTMQELFGTMGGEEFDAFFMVPEENSQSQSAFSNVAEE